MGELIAAKDWAGSALGSLDRWPSSLRTALGVCLALPTPACVVWGSERTQIYNDLYSQLASSHHSAALGKDFAHSWAQAWPTMHACFERAARGDAARLEDQRVSFDREGGSEEAMVTFSFAPIRDESGSVGGVLVTLLEAGSAKLREELARAKADLKQYGNVISHDFRAPLRTLEQIASMIVSNHAQDVPPAALNLLNHVVSGASKLAHRAEVLARIDMLTHLPLHRQRVDMSAMTAKVVEELRSATPDRNVEVAIGELPPVEADYELLRLVMQSLLANAFKFTRTREHARIDVSGRRQEHHVVYCVKDNGVGFDQKYSGRLFGFFQRMHTEAEFEGSGAGLALAKRLIERHGGTIWAEAAKDRGAELRFTLPASRPAMTTAS